MIFTKLGTYEVDGIHLKIEIIWCMSSNFLT